ncbi:hypothetical protein KKF84_10185 [Myxococcota bacterium]|nr:hypothetical protein [Myxococcota bacterium]
MTDDEIIARAESLASRQSTLGELFGVTGEELYGTASLALLLAAHGSMGEARTLMDGLLALSPGDGLLYTIYGEIAHLDGDKPKTSHLLRVSVEMGNLGPAERIRRGELAYWARDFLSARSEIARMDTTDTDPLVKNRREKLVQKLGKVNGN